MAAGHTLLKFFFRQMLDQLREHSAARVHSSLFHPAREPEKSRFWPFSIQIVLASTMRYHADLQWVRMAFRNFSRTVVTTCNWQLAPRLQIADQPHQPRLIRIVVFPIAEVRNEILPHLARRIFLGIAVEALSSGRRTVVPSERRLCACRGG